MGRRQRWMAGLVIVSGLLLPACAAVGEEEGHTGEAPATTERIPGTDVVRVLLTAAAAERLGIRVEPVRDAAGSATIPYAAVFYTADGRTWTYTSPEPLTFVRAPIVIDHVDGDVAFLSEGPP